MYSVINASWTKKIWTGFLNLRLRRTERQEISCPFPIFTNVNSLMVVKSTGHFKTCWALNVGHNSSAHFTSHSFFHTQIWFCMSLICRSMKKYTLPTAYSSLWNMKFLRNVLSLKYITQSILLCYWSRGVSFSEVDTVGHKPNLLCCRIEQN
jgi:hypothetical protein